MAQKLSADNFQKIYIKKYDDMIGKGTWRKTNPVGDDGRGFLNAMLPTIHRSSADVAQEYRTTWAEETKGLSDAAIFTAYRDAIVMAWDNLDRARDMDEGTETYRDQIRIFRTREFSGGPETRGGPAGKGRRA